MGKKGSFFSAIKRVFTHSSKDKPTDVSDKKSSKATKKGKGILSRGEKKSFIPLFRKPSSIEQILGEADQLLIRPHTPEQPKISPPLLERLPSPRPRADSPKAASPRVPSPKVPSPRAVSPRAVSAEAAPPRPISPKAVPPRPVSPKAAPPRPVSPKAAPPRPVSPKAASTSKAAAAAAPPPKATQSRKDISYVQRPEPTLQIQLLSATKIQAAYRGYMARRNFRALRGLVRLQEVVRGQNAKRQTVNAMKQMQLLVRVQTQIQSRRIQMLENQALHPQPHRNNDKDVESTLSKWMSEAGQNEDWDDSLLTKEQEEARLRKKVEAVIKRERAMAYAYSHQLWKANPKSTQTQDLRSNGHPWWWNWLERQLPPGGTSQGQSASKNITSTPQRNFSEYKASPRFHESLTPRSSRSTVPLRSAKQFQTTPRTISKLRAYDVPLKDDDSLVSCPPFSVPNYMTPTAAARAKARANSNPRERFPGSTPDSNRRFSFPLTPNKWNKGSSNKDAASHLEKNDTPRSVDSTASMPANLVARKPFNRFV